MKQQKSFFALFPLLYDWLVLRPVPCPTLMFSINVNCSALLSFVYQINYLPEMAIVRLCNVFHFSSSWRQMWPIFVYSGPTLSI